jgi:hypothetical protein
MSGARKKADRGTDIELDATSFRVFGNCEAALRALKNRFKVRTI